MGVRSRGVYYGLGTLRYRELGNISDSYVVLTSRGITIERPATTFHRDTNRFPRVVTIAKNSANYGTNPRGRRRPVKGKLRDAVPTMAIRAATKLRSDYPVATNIKYRAATETIIRARRRS